MPTISHHTFIDALDYNKELHEFRVHRDESCTMVKGNVTATSHICYFRLQMFPFFNSTIRVVQSVALCKHDRCYASDMNLYIRRMLMRNGIRNDFIP